MDKQDFDELAGRIDGIGQALLRLTAALEMQDIIDGPKMCEAWRRVTVLRPERTAVYRSAHKTLLQLAQLLDDARSSRLSREHAG